MLLDETPLFGALQTFQFINSVIPIGNTIWGIVTYICDVWIYQQFTHLILYSQKLDAKNNQYVFVEIIQQAIWSYEHCNRNIP